MIIYSVWLANRGVFHHLQVVVELHALMYVD